jgi:hypothetical protein
MSKMHRVVLKVVLGGIAVIAAPAFSKSGDTKYSDQKIKKYAERLNLLPITESPESGQYEVALEVAPNIDKHILMLGKACNHGAIPSTTMVATLAERLVGRWDVGGNLTQSAPNFPKIKMRIDSSESTQRCVESGEYKFTCYIRTRIGGTVEVPGANAAPVIYPVESDVERKMPLAQLCLNVVDSDIGQQASLLYQLVNNDDKGGIAVVNREAVIAFIANARQQIK